MNDQSAAQRLGKHPQMIVREDEPFNAGPPPQLLQDSFITPIDLFFSRNHASIPTIDAVDYRLEVGGMVTRPLSLSLDLLRDSFPRVELIATLLCAGNRRDELMALDAIPDEVPWGSEAVSNAAWAGTPLREVLMAAGIAAEAAHVAFVGLDQVKKGEGSFGFGGSLPLEKALSPEVLLAYDMNDQPLTSLHGFPLRVVAPGYIGARSVKWLTQMIVQREPSDNYYQAHAYKLFGPKITPETVDWQQGEMLGPVGLNAVIMQPQGEAILPAGPLTITGYALAAAGERLQRVEVSADGGVTWQQAFFTTEEALWAWRFWETQLELAPGQYQIIVRASDSSSTVQPADMRVVWNFKGYMNNAWQRVNVEVR